MNNQKFFFENLEKLLVNLLNVKQIAIRINLFSLFFLRNKNKIIHRLTRKYKRNEQVMEKNLTAIQD